ncbi:hypothetical protein BDQ17DRAFT_1350186 [Cyathus striatus]|nr:hypothetical protein BDQ17DRAFT_1350186 [Cyathus striatus]
MQQTIITRETLVDIVVELSEDVPSEGLSTNLPDKFNIRDNTMTFLEIVKEASSACPPLKAISAAVLILLNTARTTKGNNENLSRLADDSKEMAYVVLYNYYNTGTREWNSEIPKDHERIMFQFVEKAYSVYLTAETLRNRSWFKRFLSAKINEDTIKACRETLDQARNVLDIRLALETNRNTRELREFVPMITSLCLRTLGLVTTNSLPSQPQLSSPVSQSPPGSSTTSETPTASQPLPAPSITPEIPTVGQPPPAPSPTSETPTASQLSSAPSTTPETSIVSRSPPVPTTTLETPVVGQSPLVPSTTPETPTITQPLRAPSITSETRSASQSPPASSTTSETRSPTISRPPLAPSITSERPAVSQPPPAPSTTSEIPTTERSSRHSSFQNFSGGLVNNIGGYYNVSNRSDHRTQLNSGNTWNSRGYGRWM